MSNKVSLLEIEQNSQIGMFFIATDDFVLTGKKSLAPEQKKSIEDILQVPVVEATVFNNELVGVFLQVDKFEKKLYAPIGLSKKEITELQAVCTEYDYTFVEIETVDNTLGNLISFGKNCVFVSRDLKKDVKKISKHTKKEIVILDDENYHQAGALIYSTKNKTLGSSLLTDKTLEEIEEHLNDITTINSGSAFVSSGIVANSNGILIGADTTTVEIQIVLETFDFL